MSEGCESPLGLDTLAAYVLGELGGDAEASVEEHYFGCASCTARLQWMQGLSRGVAVVVRAGLVTAGVRGAWLRRAQDEGMRLREYTLEPGGSVNCTVAADDDFVVVRLRVDPSVRGELLVETEFHDLEHGHTERRDLESQFVDADEGALVYAFAGELVRGFPRSQWVMHVRTPEGVRVGPFTMNHVPGR